jgi:hypothetical protein
MSLTQITPRVYNVPTVSSSLSIPLLFFFFFFFSSSSSSSSSSFGVLQLMLPEALQPYGLLYYPCIGRHNSLRQFRAATPLKQRKLEL